MKAVPSIVILTGAGISAESGIKTFRDAGGLWENHAIEDVASPDGFARDPNLVQRFYNARRAQLVRDVAPNPAHLALADLESRWPGEFLLVTQNVDDLHERAGSKKLIHMHGELLKVRCTESDVIYNWREDIESDTPCACCGETGTLRPHIVWFGEMPLEMQKINRALDTCDIFISIGTSGQVYPAAGFVGRVRSRSTSRAGSNPHNSTNPQTIEINLEASSSTSHFDRVIKGPASIEVPKFVTEILGSVAR